MQFFRVFSFLMVSSLLLVEIPASATAAKAAKKKGPYAPLSSIADPAAALNFNSRVRSRAKDIQRTAKPKSLRRKSAGANNIRPSARQKAFLKDRASLLEARDQLAAESMGKILGKASSTNSKFSSRQSFQSSTPSAKSGVQASAVQAASAEFFVSSPLYFSSSSYVDNLDMVFWGDFTAPSTAEYIYLNFDYFDLEANYDKVYVYDWDGNLCDTITGLYSSGVNSAACSGNYAQVYISTDYSVNGATHDGFLINGFYYGAQVGNSPPVAIAMSDRSSVQHGQSILFTGSNSYDADSNDYIAYYSWDFGDGSADWTSSLNVNHTYAYPGTYYPTLTVWDREGEWSQDTITVVVRETPMPTNPILTQISARRMVAQWGVGNSDVDGFMVHYKTGFTSNIDCSDGWDFGYTTSAVLSGLSPSTNYTVAICAYNDYGYFSDQVNLFATTTAVTPPPIPRNLLVTDLSARQMRLNWQSGGGNTYEFFVAIAQGFTPSCTAGTNVGGNTNRLFTGLTVNKSYTMSVCARNIDGDFGPQASISATTVLPPTPVNLAVTNKGAHFITLNWNSAGGTTAGYYVNIAAGTTAPSCSTGVSIGNTTSRTFTGLAGATTYTMAVCAVSAQTDFSLPATITATTNPIVYPPVPTGLTVSGLFANRFTLNWTSGGGNTHDFVSNIAQGTTAPSCLSGVATSSTSRQFTGLLGNTTYTVAVCARNNEQDASAPVTMQVTTPPTPPAPPAPISFTVSSVSVSRVNLSWASGGGSTDSYVLAYARSTTAPSCSSGTNVGSVNSYTVTGLVSNSTYTFSLCAVNNVGVAGSRVTVQTKTLLPPPQVKSLAATSITPTSLRLTWVSGGGGTVSYRVSGALGTTAPANCTFATSTTNNYIFFSGLASFTSYSWRICSVNSQGDMSTGVTVTAKTLDKDPVNVTDLAATNIKNNSITLGWSYAGTNVAGGFVVKRATGLTPPSSCSSGSSVAFGATSFTANSLSANTNYSFRVCSKNGNGKLTTGAVITVKTFMAPPPNPRSLAVTATTKDSISVRWSSGGGITASFIVAHGASLPATGCAGGVNVGMATSYTVPGLASSTTYRIRVCAANSQGVASSGVYVSKTTPTP